MRRLSSFLGALVIALLVLMPVAAVVAQATAAPPSIGTSLVVGLAPLATTLFTSGLIYAAHELMGFMDGWSNLAKYAAMGVAGVVVSTLVNAIGGNLAGDAASWTASTAQGIASAVVGALVWKLGHGAAKGT